MAAAAGLSAEDPTPMFKDQGELSALEVAVLAERLGIGAADLATRAGVSTPVPGQDAPDSRVAALEAEVARLSRR